MPRQKNDGRGRLGGRQAGTPNKDNPLKTLLHDHSMEYFEKNIPAEEAFPKEDLNMMGEQKTGRIYSQFEIDLMNMKAVDRAKAEVELLAYHTPKMQAISADMSIKDANRSWTEVLISLAEGKELDPPTP
ncbi:MAG: hypothetical protein IJV36_02485 [Prevotella sp.]|nr:hypothetical protein [Prevotella sp.]